MTYTDDSYVGHVLTRCWRADNVGLTAPISKGERMAVVHAGTKNRIYFWGKTDFIAGSNTEDYHHEIDFENLRKWLDEKSIPNLKSNSVLVLDNVSYHNVQQDEFPTLASSKVVFQEWLQFKNIALTHPCLKLNCWNYVREKNNTSICGQ